MRRLLRPFLSALALAAALACLAPRTPVLAGDGDDAPPPAAGDANGIEQARRRWDSLPAEKRERLLNLFRRFHELPPEKRERLRERFEALGGREGVELLRRQIEDLGRSDPERLDRLRRQGRALADIEGRILDAIPPALRARIESLDPEARQVLRARVVGAATDAARRALVERFATPDERAAIDAADRDERGPLLAPVFRRAREETLAPHRERLRRLDPGARRAEEDRLFLDALWADAEPDMDAIARRLEHSLDQTPEDRHRDALQRVERWIGAEAAGLGVEGAPRRILRALLLVPRERHKEARERVREGLREVRRLPVERRREGLNRLLRELLVEFGAAGGEPARRGGR